MLGSLAHNALRWATGWLAEKAPRISGYGSVRIVRDVFVATGIVELKPGGAIRKIVINHAVPLANELVKGLKLLLKPQNIKVILGKT
jgi:hypothetical protein